MSRSIINNDLLPKSLITKIDIMIQLNWEYVSLSKTNKIYKIGAIQKLYKNVRELKKSEVIFHMMKLSNFKPIFLLRRQPNL